MTEEFLQRDGFCLLRSAVERALVQTLLDVRRWSRVAGCLSLAHFCSVFVLIGGCISQRVAELIHEVTHLFFVLTSLLQPLGFGQFECSFTQPLNFQSRALDDDAAVVIAVPLQIQALSESERWLLASPQALNYFVYWEVKVFHYLIGGDIADVAGLVAADPGVVGPLFTVIVEGQLRFDAVDAKLPTGEIRMAVANQFQLQPFVDSIEFQPPDGPAELCIVEFASVD